MSTTSTSVYTAVFSFYTMFVVVFSLGANVEVLRQGPPIVWGPAPIQNSHATYIPRPSRAGSPGCQQPRLPTMAQWAQRHTVTKSWLLTTWGTRPPGPHPAAAPRRRTGGAVRLPEVLLPWMQRAADAALASWLRAGATSAVPLGASHSPWAGCDGARALDPSEPRRRCTRRGVAAGP